jgi:hypothetical protein
MAMRSEQAWAVPRLRESLVLLASDAEMQIEWLIRVEAHSGVSDDEVRADDEWNCDELALNLEDYMVRLPSVSHDGLVSEAAAGRIHAVDQYLADMSGAEHRNLWTFGALRRAPEWQEVRRLAQLALEAMPAHRPA